MKRTESTTQAELVNVFSALGDKTRFELLQLLMNNKDHCVSELANEIGISNAGVSQQLKILEQAGLIDRVRMGQKICYKVNTSSEVSKTLLNVIS